MFDWNGDGEIDEFDMATDYWIYRQVMEEEEDDSYDEDWYNEPSYTSYAPPKKSYTPPLNEIERIVTNSPEVFGLTEIQGKTTKQILEIIINRKKLMDSYFETCSVESGYRREVIDNTQMGKDFWVYYIAKILDYSSLSISQKVKVLQLMLDVLQVNNPMTAKQHYEGMQTNNEYRTYMDGCFGMDGKCGAFYVLLVSMGPQASDGEKLSFKFIKEHMKFLVQTEVYLQKMFKGCGLGGRMAEYAYNMLNNTANAGDEDSQRACNPANIINPYYPCI